MWVQRWIAPLLATPLRFLITVAVTWGALMLVADRNGLMGDEPGSWAASLVAVAVSTVLFLGIGWLLCRRWLRSLLPTEGFRSLTPRQRQQVVRSVRRGERVGDPKLAAEVVDLVERSKPVRESVFARLWFQRTLFGGFAMLGLLGPLAEDPESWSHPLLSYVPSALFVCIFASTFVPRWQTASVFRRADRAAAEATRMLRGEEASA